MSVRTIAQDIVAREGHRALIRDGDKIVMRLYGSKDYCKEQAAKFVSPKHTTEIVPFCGTCERYHEGGHEDA